jgi:hypothetical protein
MLIRRSAAVYAALAAGTRTRRAQQVQIRRATNAAIREANRRGLTDIGEYRHRDGDLLRAHVSECNGTCGSCPGGCGKSVCECICDFV